VLSCAKSLRDEDSGRWIVKSENDEKVCREEGEMLEERFLL
jgi:hypothetical protein